MLLGLKKSLSHALNAIMNLPQSMKFPNHGPTSFLATPMIQTLLATTCCSHPTLDLNIVLKSHQHLQEPLSDLVHLAQKVPSTWVHPTTEATTTTVQDGNPTLEIEFNPLSTTTILLLLATVDLTSPCTHPLTTGDTLNQLVTGTILTLTVTNNSPSVRPPDNPKVLTVTPDVLFSLATTTMSQLTLLLNKKFATLTIHHHHASTPSHLGIKHLTGISPLETTPMVELTTMVGNHLAATPKLIVMALTNLATTDKDPLSPSFPLKKKKMKVVDPTTQDHAGTQLVTSTPMLEVMKPTNAPSPLPLTHQPVMSTANSVDKSTLTGPHGDFPLSEM